MKNNDWAFPVHADTIERCVLTKRELFAAMAMQGLISSGDLRGTKEMAIDSVDYADALINALNDHK